MPRRTPGFFCSDCGAETPRWEGRCPACGAWDSLVPAPDVPLADSRPPLHPQAPPTTPVPLHHLADQAPPPRIPTGLDELDQALGGGLVPGAAVLLAGEPGIGKSTLLLQVSAALAGRCPVLYATAEETLEQIAARARRLQLHAPQLHLLAENHADRITQAARSLQPALLVVDSIQLLRHPGSPGSPGSPAQIRRCTESLVEDGRAAHRVTLVVGHVTKEGQVAGPRLLEHLVDVVLSFEGDDRGACRVVRAVKNRHGPAGEIGVFEMTAAGLHAAPDPSALLLRDRNPAACGSAVAVLREGRRCLLVEIQALVVPAAAGLPRRTVVGLDPPRVTLLAAALERWAALPLGSADLYVGVANGLRLADPAADLPLAAAVASAATGVPLPPDAAWFGEIGLAGNLRAVPAAAARVAEARRLGLRRCFGPAGAPAGEAAPEPINDLADLVQRLRRRSPPASPRPAAPHG